MESVLSGSNLPEHKGEAAHTIPEECERLFCDDLSAIFLGERIVSGQESLGTDAGQSTRNPARIGKWIEVLDYTSDLIYRGFVTETNGDRTLFVFFGEDLLDYGLKTGLIALFELADISAFGCSQVVACVPRSPHVAEIEVIRNLGWCGFSLTTLQPWKTNQMSAPCFSTKWLFLSAEV